MTSERTTTSALRRPRSVRIRSCTIVAAGLMLSACGSTEQSTQDATSTSNSTSTTAATTASTTSAKPATNMRGQRYCEVLLLKPSGQSFSAEVYNSWPLNDCPEDQWKALDATKIAADNGAPIAVLNGPRYWLMDSIEKAEANKVPKATFGGIEMYRQATVEVGPLAEAKTPYKPHAVDRKTIFSFNAGSTVYELHSSDGATYVMQTWSQTIDPALAEADLAGLASRLKLPDGWSFTARTLDEPLSIVTTDVPAQVLQDDLQNSYSLETTT